ncbi:Uncharacterised protein [Mycobacteroides abscessus subsp. abscessus]|nr:Uncharacterised protein [Mycobacteroides abscessus subsp. abscessus]
MGSAGPGAEATAVPPGLHAATPVDSAGSADPTDPHRRSGTRGSTGRVHHHRGAACASDRGSRILTATGKRSATGILERLQPVRHHSRGVPVSAVRGRRNSLRAIHTVRVHAGIRQARTRNGSREIIVSRPHATGSARPPTRSPDPGTRRHPHQRSSLRRCRAWTEDLVSVG